MMRLLLVLPEFPPSVGGMQTHAAYLSRHLSSKGHDVEVATYRATAPALRDEARLFDRELNFPVRRVLSRLGFWHNIDTLGRIVESSRPDLIYASTVFYGLLSLHTSVPVVCRSVGNDLLRPWMGYPYRYGSGLFTDPRIERLAERCAETFNFPEWLEAMFRRKRFDVMRRAARRTDKVLANSRFTATLLEEVGVRDERIDTLVGGVDSEKFRRPPLDLERERRELGLPAGGFVILTACRLVAKKGVDLLLRAMTRVKREHPDSHLVIVGEGKHRRAYESLAAELGLEGSVTFAGRVAHDRVHRYYWSSDLFVLASREAVNPFTGVRDVETMGRVLCEANAAGLPLLASRSGGIPSIVADGVNGLLFEENDADDLLAKLRRLRTEPALVSSLVENGLRMAREVFDWSVVLGHHERVFAETTSRSGSGASARELSFEPGRLATD